MNIIFSRQIFQTTLVWLNKHPIFLVLAPPLILFLPMMLRGEALFWGTPILQFVPWRYLALETLLRGELPLWNPYSGMGSPLLANYQTAIFYPPNWFLFVLGGLGGVTWLAWGHTLVVIFHLCIAGWGMIKLCRSLGLSEIGQSICSLSFSLSLYLIARSGFFTINATAAWLPWVAYLTLPHHEKHSNDLIDNRTIQLAIVISLIFLAGHAQTTFYVLLFSFAWVIFWIFTIQASNRSENGFKRLEKQPLYLKTRSLIRFLTGIIFGFFIASIQLIPTLEYLLNSQRAENVDSLTAMTYSFWPWRYLTLFAPEMFGSPAQNTYWGFGNYWEDAIYVGMLPLILFFIAFINLRIWSKIKQQESRDRYHQKMIWFLLAVMLISTLVALGRYTPFFPFLYQYIPPFNMFQAPTRINLLVVFSISLIAGVGIDLWTQPTGRRLYWTRLSIAGAVALALGAGLAWILLGEVHSTFVSSCTKAGFLAAASIALLLFRPESSEVRDNTLRRSDLKQEGLPSLLWNLVVILFVSFDLIWASWSINPTHKASLYIPESDQVQIINNQRKGGRLFLNPLDEYQLKFNEFFRFQSYESTGNWRDLWSAMLPNMNILAHIPSANQFDPLVPSRYQTWLDLLNSRTEQGDEESLTYLLNLSNITLVEVINPKHRSGVDYIARRSFDRFRWVPCGVSVSTAQDALDYLLAGELDFSNNVVVETKIQNERSNCVVREENNQIDNAKIEVVSERSNQIRLQVDSFSPGFLVVSDIWYPGWVAYVNGKFQKVEKANYLFQAVLLNAGENEVSLVYKPLSFYLGLSITFFSIFSMVSYMLLHRNLHEKAKQS